MTKFTKLTVCAIVALLLICLSSTTFAQKTSGPDVTGLPSGVLPTGTGTGDEGEGATSSPSPAAATSSPAPSGPVPSGPVPSGATPSPSGSAAAAISSIFGKYSSTASGAPTYSAATPTDTTAAKAPPAAGSASKIENGLISGVIIAGIINLFI